MFSSSVLGNYIVDTEIPNHGDDTFVEAVTYEGLLEALVNLPDHVSNGSAVRLSTLTVSGDLVADADIAGSFEGLSTSDLRF